ncbi:MAG TPA: hypothetical protein VHA33_07660 [Candidatus Angelobacter sp.]|jgi:hypothetical protein|nr:hypothetical protein [Candidatus Angelobacter sp.]
MKPLTTTARKSKPQDASLQPFLNLRSRGLLDGIHPQRFSQTGTGVLQRKCGCATSPLHLAPPLMRAPASGLRVNQPGDQYEQEADRVAEQVMRITEPGTFPGQPGPSTSRIGLQRRCAGCEEEEEKYQIQRQATNTGPGVAPPIVHEVSTSSGQPLDGHP